MTEVRPIHCGNCNGVLIRNPRIRGSIDVSIKCAHCGAPVRIVGDSTGVEEKGTRAFSE